MHECVNLMVVRACPLQEVLSPRYAVMYYGASMNIGIRRKFDGKNQSISFGGKKFNLSEEVLRGWADDCLRKLNNDEPESEVEDWVRTRIGQGLKAK